MDLPPSPKELPDTCADGACHVENCVVGPCGEGVAALFVLGFSLGLPKEEPEARMEELFEEPALLYARRGWRVPAAAGVAPLRAALRVREGLGVTTPA